MATSTNSRLVVGNFNSNEVKATLTPNNEVHSKEENIVTTPPMCPHGLRLLDIDMVGNIRVKSATTPIDRTKFKAQISTWNITKLHSAEVSWIEVPSTEYDIQFGGFSTEEVRPYPQLQTETSKNVTFSRPYSSPPQVVVWLTALDIDEEFNWRVTAYASNVTPTGFTIHIDSWADTKLYMGAATWIAFPSDKAGMQSGQVSTSDIRPPYEPRIQNSSHIKFPSGKFKRTPTVVMCLNKIDIDKRHNLRVKATTSDVSAAGMTWHLDAWADTMLFEAGATYIAIE